MKMIKLIIVVVFLITGLLESAYSQNIITKINAGYEYAQSTPELTLVFAFVCFIVAGFVVMVKAKLKSKLQPVKVR